MIRTGCCTAHTDCYRTVNSEDNFLAAAASTAREDTVEVVAADQVASDQAFAAGVVAADQGAPDRAFAAGVVAVDQGASDRAFAAGVVAVDQGASDRAFAAGVVAADQGVPDREAAAVHTVDSAVGIVVVVVADPLGAAAGQASGVHAVDSTTEDPDADAAPVDSVQVDSVPVATEELDAGYRSMVLSETVEVVEQVAPVSRCEGH
jgi:hypothetical protein